MSRLLKKACSSPPYMQNHEAHSFTFEAYFAPPHTLTHTSARVEDAFHKEVASTEMTTMATPLGGGFPITRAICNYKAKRHSPTCFGMQPNHGGCLLCCYTGYLGIFSSFLVSMETSYPEKTRVSCPSRAENTPTRYKSPKVGFPGLGSRKFTSWRAKSQVGAPSPDLARQLATWRAPNFPPPIKPSTCIPLLSLEIPSLTCPCTLGTKKALFHLFLINVQKTANVQEAVKSII